MSSCNFGTKSFPVITPPPPTCNFGIKSFFVSEQGTYGWGMWMKSTSEMIAYNSDVGKSMPFWCSTAWMPEQRWDTSDSGYWTIKSIVDAAYAHNAQPVIMWSPSQNLPQDQFYNQAFINGTYDSYLIALATGMKNDGRIIHFRMFHEMNGRGWNGCGWGSTWCARWYANSSDAFAEINPINTPATFIAAWRHIVQIFKNVGANNVKFWFTIGPLPSVGYEGHDNDGAIPLSQIYPGDSFVDYLGYEFYTPAGTHINDIHILGSYHELSDVSSSKPIVVSEAGLNTQDSVYASAWWSNALNASYVKSLYPRTSGILIWNDLSFGLNTTALRNQGIVSFQTPIYKNGM